MKLERNKLTKPLYNNEFAYILVSVFMIICAVDWIEKIQYRNFIVRSTFIGEKYIANLGIYECIEINSILCIKSIGDNGVTYVFMIVLNKFTLPILGIGGYL